MKFKITKYWIGIVLVAISCGATNSLYPLLAFFGGMLIYHATKENQSFIKEHMTNNTRLNLTGEFSLYAKRITITINGVKHDFSEKIPDAIWRLGVGDNIANLNNPHINWKIRRELSKEINKLVNEFLGRQDIQIVL